MTPRSFQCRHIFGLGLLTFMRSKELEMLKISEIKKIIEGTSSFFTKTTMGGFNSNSKNSKRYMKQTNEITKEVPIFEIYELDCLVNVHKDVVKYLQTRIKMHVTSSIPDGFF